MGNEQSSTPSRGFETHQGYVKEMPGGQTTLDWHALYMDEELKQHAAAINELQKSLQALEPSSKPEFPIERPAHFDETKRGTWDELTVLDIVEQGMGSLTYSKNAMEIWPTNADVGDVNAWGADGNKEVTEQVLNVIARVIERLGELKKESRLEDLCLNDTIGEVICGPWVFKNLMIKKNTFRGFMTSVVTVEEVVWNGKEKIVVLRNLELEGLPACLTKEGGVWIHRIERLGMGVKQARESAAKDGPDTSTACTNEPAPNPAPESDKDKDSQADSTKSSSKVREKGKSASSAKPEVQQNGDSGPFPETQDDNLSVDPGKSGKAQKNSDDKPDRKTQKDDLSVDPGKSGKAHKKSSKSSKSSKPSKPGWLQRKTRCPESEEEGTPAGGDDLKRDGSKKNPQADPAPTAPNATSQAPESSKKSSKKSSKSRSKKPCCDLGEPGPQQSEENEPLSAAEGHPRTRGEHASQAMTVDEAIEAEESAEQREREQYDVKKAWKAFKAIAAKKAAEAIDRTEAVQSTGAMKGKGCMEGTCHCQDTKLAHLAHYGPGRHPRVHRHQHIVPTEGAGSLKAGETMGNGGNGQNEGMAIHSAMHCHMHGHSQRHPEVSGQPNEELREAAVASADPWTGRVREGDSENAEAVKLKPSKKEKSKKKEKKNA